MSCIVDLEKLSFDTRKKLSTDLEIIPKESKYGKQESIMAFDTYEEEQEDKTLKYFINIPFSYYFHHLSKILNVKFPNDNIIFPKASGYTFEGQLNKVQTEIKDETYDILNRTRSVLISLFCGAGKCLAPDTPVLLWDGGIKKAKDVRVGDLLVGDDNSYRTVLSINNGREKMYKIHQNKGDDYIVNESHILSLKVSQHKRHTWNSNQNSYVVMWFDFDKLTMSTKSFSVHKYGTKEKAFEEMELFKSTIPDDDVLDIEVKDYLKLSKRLKTQLKGFKTGVNFPKQSVFIDPYVLGAWLGDGDSNGRGFTNIDEECLSYFRKYIESIGCKMNQTPSDPIHYCISHDTLKSKRNTFLDLIDFYNLRKNKHIPKDYLINDRQTRLELLAGLLDTDGYLYHNCCYEITQKRKNLSDNILYLVRSLGFNATQTEKIGRCKYKGKYSEGLYYKIIFSGEGTEQIPCKIPRKKSSKFGFPELAPEEFSKRLINKNALMTRIEVEELNEGDYYGFEIDGNKRFLLGDFTVTHNTIYSIFLASKLQYKVMVLCHRVNLIDQWEYSIHKVCPDALVQVLDGKTTFDPEGDFFIMNVANVSKRKRNEFSSIGILIVDEAHTICTENLSQSLFWFQPKYTIFLTATPDRTDGKGKLLELYVGPERIERKLYRPFNAYVIHTGFKPTAKQNAQGRLDWNSVLESQSLNEERNDLIVDIIRYFRNRNFLILCKRVDQSKILLEKLKAYNEDVDMFTGTSKKFNRDSRILISTYSKTGVGFDHAKLDALIVAADVEEGIEQYVGRVFRREDVVPIVFDLLDKMHTLFKHFITRRTLYTAIGGDVKDFYLYFPEFKQWRNM